MERRIDDQRPSGCTVIVNATGGICGAEPVTYFISSISGDSFAECALHDVSPIVDRIDVAAKAKARANLKCDSCGHVHTYFVCQKPVGPRHLGDVCGCSKF